MTLSVPLPNSTYATCKERQQHELILFNYGKFQYYIPKTFRFGNLPKINLYQCAKCGQYMTSKKDLLRHNCLPTNRQFEPYMYNEKNTLHRLLDLIAFNNYSYHSVENAVFQQFIDSFCRGFQIPKQDALENDMHQYAMEIQEATLTKLSHQIVSLLIDGGSKVGRKFEGVLLWSLKRVYFYSLEQCQDFKTSTLSQDIEAIINKLRSYNIIVLAICSDNASNNKALFNATNEYNILDQGLVHIPCCSHMINLAVHDTLHNPNTLPLLDAIRSILGLKIPHFSPPKLTEVRWCSFFECILYIIGHLSVLPHLLDETIRTIDLDYDWQKLDATAKVMLEFIKETESDSIALSSIFPKISNTISKLKNIGGVFALTLSVTIKNRVFQTEGIGLPILSYLLTGEGFAKYKQLNDQNLQMEIFTAAQKGIEQYAKARHIEDYITTAMYSGLAVYLFYGEKYIPFHSNSDSLSTWEKALRDKSIPLVLQKFAFLAYEVLQIPATEAPVERIFSHLGAILTPQRTHLLTEKINDLMIVKANILFKSLKYPLSNGLLDQIKNVFKPYPELLMD